MISERELARREALRKRNRTKIAFKHGRTHTPEYAAYTNALTRCTNPTHDKYRYYGGRGIKFLFVSFEQFFAEIGEKPSPKRRYTLDRRNNSGHYEPGNVHWVTWHEQNCNRRPKGSQK